MEHKGNSLSIEAIARRAACPRKLFDQLEGEKGRISDAVQAHARKTADRADRAAVEARWTAIGSLLLMLTVLSGIAHYSRKHLIAPIATIADNVRAIAEGRLDMSIGQTERAKPPSN